MAPKHNSLSLLFDRDKMYLYPWYISDLTITRDIKEIAGIKVEEMFGVIEKDFIKIYGEPTSVRRLGLYFFNKILKDYKFLDRVLRKIYLYADDLLIFCKKIKKIEILKLSSTQLISIYREYIKKLCRVRAWGWVPVFLDGVDENYLTRHLQDKLHNFLRERNERKKFGELYSLLSSSEKKSEVQKEEIVRLKILLQIMRLSKPPVLQAIQSGNSRKIKKDFHKVWGLLNGHLRDYGWLTYAYSGPPMSLNHLLKMLAENLSENETQSRLKEIKNHFRNINNEKLRIIKKFGLSRELQYLFKVSAELMYIKDYRKGIYQKSYVIMDLIMAELARRIGTDLKGVKFLLVDETQKALKDPKKWLKIIKERKKLCCYISKNGRIIVYEGKKAKEMIVKKVPYVSSSDDVKNNEAVLKGMVAYSGVARGRVKVVSLASEVDKVKKGDIIVSPATNPDLVLAMKRAAAIVTDTGGIVSHAAIVSRELKKPCVVGTKIATKIFKDGDLIEVDATKGVVRKITQ